SGSGLKVAGATTRFDGQLQSEAWSLSVAGEGLDLVAARKLAQPWLQLPPQDSLAGHLQFRLESTGRLEESNSGPGGGPGKLQVRFAASSADLNYSNQPGTTVGQDVAATVTGSAVRDHGKLTSDLQLRSSSGQVLVGAVLLDFAKNPLNLQAHLE